MKSYSNISAPVVTAEGLTSGRVVLVTAGGDLSDVAVVPAANLGTGVRDGTKYLRDDGQWSAVSGGGGGGSTGIVTGTSGEALAVRDIVYCDVANARGGGAGKWWKVDLSTTPARVSALVGLATAAAASGAAVTAQAFEGDVAGFTGLAFPSPVYAAPAGSFDPTLIQAAAAGLAPAVYWKLDEAAGAATVADASGNGRGGTTSAVTLGVTGPTGGNTGVRLGANPSTITSTSYIFNSSIATLAAWIKVSAYPPAQAIVFGCTDGLGSGNWDKGVQINPTGTVTARSLSVTVTTTAVVPLNTWTHVLVRYNGATQDVFINGVLSATIACTSTYAGYVQPNLMIGGYYGGIGVPNADTVSVDEFFVKGAALSDSEVFTLANGAAASAGSYTQTAPSAGQKNVVKVGYATSATTVHVSPEVAPPLVAPTAGDASAGTAYLRDDGQWVNPTTAGGLVLTNPVINGLVAGSWYVGKRMPAQVGTTSVTQGTNTLTNMNFPIGANEVWAFEFHLFAQGGTTGGVKFQVTGPASPTAFMCTMAVIHSTLSSGGTVTALSTPSAALLTNGSGTVKICGVLTNGPNAGTVTLQFASGTAANTSTVFLNSYMIARRIA